MAGALYLLGAVMEAMKACPICGQTRAEGERRLGVPCNDRCARIRRDANGERLRLFDPVAVIPGQQTLGAEGAADG